MGIVDSGVDYRHPDFCNEDGSTRILRLWDQTVQGNAPEGYRIGTEYTKAQIDEALRLPPQEGYQVVASRDLSGHGTSVWESLREMGEHQMESTGEWLMTAN